MKITALKTQKSGPTVFSTNLLSIQSVHFPHLSAQMFANSCSSPFTNTSTSQPVLVLIILLKQQADFHFLCQIHLFLYKSESLFSNLLSRVNVLSFFMKLQFSVSSFSEILSLLHYFLPTYDPEKGSTPKRTCYNLNCKEHLKTILLHNAFLFKIKYVSTATQLICEIIFCH